MDSVSPIGPGIFLIQRCLFNTTKYHYQIGRTQNWLIWLASSRLLQSSVVIKSEPLNVAGLERHKEGLLWSVMCLPSEVVNTQPSLYAKRSPVVGDIAIVYGYALVNTHECRCA
jgi:hypothetical protein